MNEEVNQSEAAMSQLDAVLDDLFTYHPPTEEQKALYAEINDAAKVFARVVLRCCPSSPDRTSAIQDIRMARMRANSSIATKTGGLIPR